MLHKTVEPLKESLLCTGVESVQSNTVQEFPGLRHNTSISEVVSLQRWSHY